MSSEAKVSYDLKRFAGIKRDYTPEEVERLKRFNKNRIFDVQTSIKKIMEFIKF